MYGREYMDWLEGEHLEEVSRIAKASVDCCPATFDGHDFQSVRVAGGRHYYVCRNCEATIGISPVEIIAGHDSGGFPGHGF